MNQQCGRTDENTRLWRAEDGIHIDVRGLDPPQPVVRLFELIDASQVGAAVVTHFSYEPTFLYPELEYRGWDHEIVACDDDDADCEDVTLRLVRFA
jgi:Uncharacterized conserved protein (DUF2249)